MILVPKKNLYSASRSWGTPKYQKGILHPVGFWGQSDYALGLSNLTINDVFDPSYAGFRLNRDGTMDGRDSAGYYTVGSATQWIEAAGRYSTVGDLYEFQTVKTGGADSLIGVTDSVWADINTTREGYITTSSLPVSYVGTLTIREKADTGNSVSCTLTFDGAIA